jgi:curved DNA-binding protein CbpA/DNA-binding NarL/FixJ family response regulator
MAKKLLILENEGAFGQLLSQVLRQHGYQVILHTEAETGLDALLESPFDLALIEFALPAMSGVEILQALRNHSLTRELPVLLMTAFHSAYDTVTIEDDFTSCLTKPFSGMDLVAMVSARLDEAESPAAGPSEELTGNLAETSFPRLLHNLYTLRASGLLQLEHGPAKKVICMKEGVPVCARSNLARERLGQRLVDSGRITPEQCDASLERARQSGRLHGTALIELGLLTPHQLYDSLQEQARDKLLEIFSWSDGQYRWSFGRGFKEEITSIDLPPEAMIAQGIRRHFTPAQIADLLAPHGGRYLLQSANPLYQFSELDPSAEQACLWEECSGESTLEELLDRHPHSRGKNESLLATLLLIEMLESRDQPLCAEEGGDLFQRVKSQQLQETLLTDYDGLMDQDYFALFGLAETATSAEIRSAYFVLAKQYHPDNLSHPRFPAELGEKGRELFQRINEAYAILSDPGRRRDYLAQLHAGGASALERALAAIDAEAAFQKGRVYLRAKKYPEAFQHLEKAIRHRSEEPEYLSLYAWAMAKTFAQDPKRVAAARQRLLHSLELNPRLDLTHLYLGYLLQAEGQIKAAERSFELAIQCNPNNIEALRELRLSSHKRE